MDYKQISTETWSSKIAYRLGPLKMVLLITFISIAFSLFLEVLFSYLLGVTISKKAIISSIVIPAIAAPIVSWGFVKFFYKTRRLEDRIRQMATYDEMTGLMTRSAFIWKAERIYAECLKRKKRMVVVYIDLDNFKTINDLYGHAAGDEVLTYSGKAILEIFPKEVPIGRIGGDEIALVLYGESPEYTLKMLKRFNSKLLEYQSSKETTKIQLTASIGVSSVDQLHEGISFDIMLVEADRALYYAKHHGRNRIILHKKNKKHELLAS